MESCSIILLCLILFIMMSSSFICIATYYKISFLLKANIPLGVHATFSQSIAPLVGIYLRLATFTSAVVKMDVSRSLHPDW